MMTTKTYADMIHVGWTVEMVPSGTRKVVARTWNLGSTTRFAFTDGTTASFLPNARLTVHHA